MDVLLRMIILTAGLSSWKQQVHLILPSPPPSDSPFPLSTSEPMAVFPWSGKRHWFWAERTSYLLPEAVSMLMFLQVASICNATPPVHTQPYSANSSGNNAPVWHKKNFNLSLL
ncbi:hypothetical protein Baya_4445 [Bagarius yarrelli]|uniref:Uncharacterized protein n=1 Tax=Bagarius yarrelli TaxID=175774 RepID=A0A556TQ79_BAGYA|nr:hypothetical protein Baya_4445 [Bagarius yarrelli]